MAMALPADGFVTAIDKNPEWTARAQQHWKDAGFDDRIGLRIGDGTALLEELITEKGEGFFDFAFIDADKKNYAAYYSLCIRLVRKGGIIAVDNTLWRTTLGHDDIHFFNCDAMRDFNEMLFKDERIELSILPVADGLTIARIK